MQEQRGEDSQPLRPVDQGPRAESAGLEGRIQELEADLEESNRERSQYREALVRAQADLSNYKRRSDEERGEQTTYANSRLILKVLPVLDDLGLAMEHVAESDAGASWLEGVQLIHRKLQSLVESEAVTRIDPEGRDFEPTEHEAMGYQETRRAWTTMRARSSAWSGTDISSTAGSSGRRW